MQIAIIELKTRLKYVQFSSIYSAGILTKDDPRR